MRLLHFPKVSFGIRFHKWLLGGKCLATRTHRHGGSSPCLISGILLPHRRSGKISSHFDACKAAQWEDRFFGAVGRSRLTLMSSKLLELHPSPSCQMPWDLMLFKATLNAGCSDRYCVCRFFLREPESINCMYQRPGGGSPAGTGGVVL